MDIQAIEKTKQQWQSAADLIPQLICLLNGEGRVIHVNRTLEWWGLGTVASAKGRAPHDILHPNCADPECHFRKFWQDSTPARLAGKRSQHEIFDPLRDRHYQIRVQPLAWRSSERPRTTEDLHTVVVVDDISDLKLAEAGVQQRYADLVQQMAHETERRTLSEEMQTRLLTILEKTTDFVAMADASESLLYLNPAGRRMLGLGPREDVSGIRLCDHAATGVREYLRDIAIPAAVKNGLWAGESRLRDSTGRDIYTSQVIIAHRKANGQVDCLSTILRDISERVHSEQALRESQNKLLRLSGVLVSLQEDERRRIALDLHDGLGQSLSLLKLTVENATEQVAAGESATALELLHQITGRLKEALTDVRRVSTELRPSILDDLGILPTLSWFFREFEAACSRIRVEKALNIREKDVPAELRITLYRILQEATSNIVKHAGASHMWVSLSRDDSGLHLAIEDNGRGFDQDSIVCHPGERRGLGLVSMRERVSLSGGSYRLESGPGCGTRILASWPIE